MNIKYFGKVNQKDYKVATIGYFDGLHLGHKEIIKKTISLSKKLELPSCLITFNQSAISLLKDYDDKSILSFNEKKEFIFDFGIDEIIYIELSKEDLKIKPLDFINNVLVKLNIKKFVCGRDFSFGYQGLGNPELLANYFDVEIVEDYTFDSLKISTKLIKQLLSNKDLEKANKLLGYNYFINDKVIHGFKIGTTLGFKTANISIDNLKYLPNEGVYIGKSLVRNKYYYCLINLGHNPTVHNNLALSLEVHLLDFNYDVYDENIKVEFIKFLRDEIKFNNISDLINQISKDKEEVIRYFNCVV